MPRKSRHRGRKTRRYSAPDMTSRQVYTSVRTKTTSYPDGRKKIRTYKTVTEVTDGVEKITNTEYDGPPKLEDAFDDASARPEPSVVRKTTLPKVAKQNKTPTYTSARAKLKNAEFSQIIDQSQEDFLFEGVQCHNQYRSQHDAQPLSLCPKLCDVAADWAGVCASRHVMEHRPNGAYGENIYYGYNSQAAIKAHQAVDAWYNEIVDYDFKKHCKKPTGGPVGHFTQVVWKGSERIGLGRAKASDGTVYIVANYDPPGNWLGEFDQNVVPKQSESRLAPLKSTQNRSLAKSKAISTSPSTRSRKRSPSRRQRRKSRSRK